MRHLASRSLLAAGRPRPVPSVRLRRLRWPVPDAALPPAHDHARRRLFWRGARATTTPSPPPSSAAGGQDGGPAGSGFQWYYIPIGLGVAFLGAIRVYKLLTQPPPAAGPDRQADENGGAADGRRGGAQGPWVVRVMSTLPLKAMSRLWGRFNELEIPRPLRVPGFRLYSSLFGVNLSEISEPDLRTYPNLAAFFYRTLKLGARPLDPDPNALLSPADGRVLQFGRIDGGNIEQVKGVTYSVDALLGRSTPALPPPPPPLRDPSTADSKLDARVANDALVRQDEEFARLNGISYTLPGLLSGSSESQRPTQQDQPAEQTQKPEVSNGADAELLGDQSVAGSTSAAAVSKVQQDLALGSGSERKWYSAPTKQGSGGGGQKTALFYAVVYLAPGDYHRFHSPVNWVVERRRHFAGELYSVSPYLQRTLPGLFTLNERVVLLGRWRWGFFGVVPVGATNVGSIKVNFDRELRTNSLTTSTAADRAASRGRFSEATYAAASPVLGGHALRRGDEMGGFRLGSTVVLVFEAPVPSSSAHHSGFHWTVQKGQRIKVGQALGRIG